MSNVTRVNQILKNTFPLVEKHLDVLVIGGGVVGCAIARELMRYKLDVILVEKEHDVAQHSSGNDDGMIYSVLNLRKGRLEKKYNDAGNQMFPELYTELNMPFRYSGQYLCFTQRWMKPVVFVSLLYWKLAGIPVKYVSRKFLISKEPSLADDVNFALYFPTAGVICPRGLAVSYIENAADNGAKICLDTAVTNIEVFDGMINSVMTNHGRVFPKLVINAAGVFAEEIARFARDCFFSIQPRYCANMTFDKKAAHLADTITLPFKLSDVMFTKEQQGSITGLCNRDVLTYFSGVHAAVNEDDFIVSFGKYTKNIIHAAGIQSPWLGAASAVAKDVAEMAAGYLNAGMNEKFNPVRKATGCGAELSNEQREDIILSQKFLKNVG
jgi:glycerol-3-phosphate dehydrogenase